MGRTTTMIVCMSNSFLSDIGALIGFILVCILKKKRKGGEKKRNFFPFYIIWTSLRDRFKAGFLTTFFNKGSGDIFILTSNK